MGFHVTEATCYLTADLFYLEVALLPCGRAEDVKVARHGGLPLVRGTCCFSKKKKPTSCVGSLNDSRSFSPASCSFSCSGEVSQLRMLSILLFFFCIFFFYTLPSRQCWNLASLLRRESDFEGFSRNLEALFNQYNIPGDKYLHFISILFHEYLFIIDGIEFIAIYFCTLLYFRDQKFKLFTCLQYLWQDLQQISNLIG